MPRPDSASLIGKDAHDVPMSLQRVLKASEPGQKYWIGPHDAVPLSKEETHQYALAGTIMAHLAIRAPSAAKSGHPGGPLSAFDFAYWINTLRNPTVDQPLRMSAGHLSVLAYGLQYLFGKDRGDKRLSNPEAIIRSFRTADGLPGHIEAGIGNIPFGTGPLGKGVSNGLGAAFGLKLQKKKGLVDVLLADGDSQEGQVQEAFRLAVRLGLDNLIVHGDWNDIQLSGMPSKTVACDFASIAAATGWNVIEVQNGNDAEQVKAALQKANALTNKSKPIFICYYTTMGHGIPLMERGSDTGLKNFHGSPLSEEEAEEALKDLPSLEKCVLEYGPYHASEKKRYGKADRGKRNVETDIPLEFDAKKLKGYKRAITAEKGAARKDFGATHLFNLMKADDRIVVLHADLAGSGGFDAVEKAFPDRCINVGVAEANMYMMAAGMRQVGLLPVTYTFAAFGTNEARANVRLIDINCGHTRCGVMHDCTHAGLSVGEDGETHQERHYLNIPFDHTEVWMTADSNQAAAMAEKALEKIAEGHTSIFTFFPRDGHPQIKSPDGSILYGSDYVFDGTANIVRGNGDTTDNVTVIATGIPVHSAIEAADMLKSGPAPISVRVLNVACIRPIDASAVIEAALETGHIVVVEDHCSEGGLASQVADIIADFALPCSLRRLGVNHYFPSAPAKDLYVIAGIDHESIADALQDEVRAEFRGSEDAFVTTIYELMHNSRHSRFGTKVQSFTERLTTEKGYMDTLRKHWASRECPKEQLPKNEELLNQLKESL